MSQQKLISMSQSYRSEKKQKKKKEVFKKKPKQTHEQKVNEFFGHLNQHKQQALSHRIKNYCGKNFPITYRPEYLFTQQWETTPISENSKTNNLMELLGSKFLAYQICTMVSYSFAIWTISMERYFSSKAVSSTFPLFYLLLISNLTDIIIRTAAYYSQTQICPDFKNLIRFYYRNLILITYSVIMIAYDNQYLVMNFVELLAIYFLYHRASKIYKYIKIMEFGLHYENYLKIFDLLLNIFIQAHVFAILLFSASNINPTENWLNSIGIQNDTPIVKYINSIYFACTTMLTIGYGDISPKSVGEKCVTILIEIVGVIAFGYMLNEMGHTLSKMREQSEVMQRDLQTISKISKYYNLQPILQNKARNFILNNKKNNEQLKIEDQNRLLQKLNEDLRQEINMENSLNVVKSSIFYLCHWTKNMQNEIAKRLQKRVFSPNQMIAGKQRRIYIIKKGRIDISMNRYRSNQEHRKVMKIIDTKTKKHIEVSDNVYGYTAVFSNRPVKLQAISKDFTSTYSVSKNDFLFCVNQNRQDFQYYHEIKSRIDQSVFCEEWETPAIKNVREHYCPSHILIIKKHRKDLQENINERCLIERQNRKLRKYRLIANFFNKVKSTGHSSRLSQKTIEFTTEKPTQLDSIREANSELTLENDSEEISKRCLELVDFRLKFSDHTLDNSEKKQMISCMFESAKEYTNFFKQNNLEFVLQCFEKSNFMENRFTEGEEATNWNTTVNYLTSFVRQ